jgi:glycosyltransferase involved in cell wall biosynthesis
MNLLLHANLILVMGTDIPAGISVVLIAAWVVTVCAAIPAALFAVNVWFFRRPGRPWNKRLLPPISVLIPARNEEHSIAGMIGSVLASRGVDLELIVLDDGSTDGTAEVVRAAAERDARVHLELAPPLPEGWNGKQHACWVLAGLARRDVFCFLDADVRVGSEAIYRMTSELNFVRNDGVEMALVSGFLRQETETFLEWLLLPLIQFVLLGFLPLPGERWSGRSEFAAGCGQFLMVRKEAYFSSGGHAAIRTTMHDGLLLPRLLRRNGFRTRVYDLSRDVVCRMYRSAGEVWQGLAKNATEGMASPGRIHVFTVLLLAGQVLPAVIAPWAWLQQNPVAIIVSMSALGLGYAVRLLSAWRYRQSWRGAALHPLGVLILLGLQWYALVGKLTHRPAIWKQRTYEAGS